MCAMCHSPCLVTFLPPRCPHLETCCSSRGACRLLRLPTAPRPPSATARFTQGVACLLLNPHLFVGSLRRDRLGWISEASTLRGTGVEWGLHTFLFGMNERMNEVRMLSGNPQPGKGSGKAGGMDISREVRDKAFGIQPRGVGV